MKIEIDGEVKNFPDFLIVGTGKAGTTTLYNCLDEHPQIVVPERKETRFYQIISNPNKSVLKYSNSSITTHEEYLGQFNEVSHNQICGEVCPSYLSNYEHTISNIKKYHPRWKDLKIIIILREPVDKIISQYHFVTNTIGINDGSLENALRLEPERVKCNDVLQALFYVKDASYYPQVKFFKKNFENVRVYFYEDFKKNNIKFFSNILSYLEVDDTFKPNSLNRKFNSSTNRWIPKNKISGLIYWIIKKLLPLNIRRNIPLKFRDSGLNMISNQEKISDETKLKLKKFFKSEVRKLEDLLEKDLSFWGYNSIDDSNGESKNVL